MDSSDESDRTSSSLAAVPENSREAEHEPSKTLANVALALGLYAAIGPFLFLLEWNSPFYIGLPCSAAGAGFYVAPFGLILGVIALSLRSKNPRRYGGQRRAAAAVLTSLIGFGWFGLIMWSHAAQYGPWGVVIQAAVNSRLGGVAEALQEHAKSHEGRFPSRLTDLLVSGSEDSWILRIDYCHTANEVVDFHYVSGLDQSCPTGWPLVFADSNMFNDEGGGIIYVDGTVKLLDEPDFSLEIERFVQEFRVARGNPPEIIAPH